MQAELFENETLTEVNDKIKLIQNPKGLTFGTDALLLAAFVRRDQKAVSAEFGAGSGIISMLLAARGKLGHIYAVEIQPEYASISQRNVKLNCLEEKITVCRSDLRDFVPLSGLGTLSVVFTNPPYMTVSAGYRNTDDGKFAARHELNGSIFDFCRAAAAQLNWGGAFYCVYRPDRLVDLICAMREAAIEPKRMIFVFPDKLHSPCLVLVEGKRGAKPSLCIPKSLYLYEDGTQTPTAELEYIYENGEFKP